MVENIHRQLAQRHGTQYRVRDVIFAAASEVNRPIVYAIAVIVAGFLPIYALTGPSGKLFRPMADTTIYALLGALLLTLTVIPVLCAWVFRRGVKDRTNRAFEWMRARYAAGLDWCLGHRPHTLAGALVLFGASLLIAVGRGGEFMPKLDEGAIWVRATMPYTISFEASSQIVPQIRSALQSFPEVTVMLPYVTSKGAMLAFTRALSRELGQYGIAVNSLSPGYILSDTGLENAAHVEEERVPVRNSRAFKRDAYPEDLLGTLVFLASSDSDFVTGQSIVVDGGSVNN